ncbi:MAG: hypothetical protein C0434_00950 [Xanthomonadaceae bacterium]|nr:hypothetical protein [Xanthomonadaceae bacterium]
MTPFHTGVATTPDEVRQCLELRYAANLADGKQSTFLDHERGVVTDSLDEIATIHWIKDGARIIGTMRSVWGGDRVPAHYADWFSLDQFSDLLPGQIAFTSRLIIAPEYRKTLALQSLLDACYLSGRRKGVRIDFMHASPELIGLYERVGYQCFRAGVIDTDVGHHVPMLLTADAHDWLEAIRSPFSACTSEFEANPDRRDWFRRHCDPGLRDGLTPGLLGKNGFAARLTGRGAHDLAGVLRVSPERLRGCALFSARVGDTVASSRDRFGAGLVQLSGSSRLYVDGVARTRHEGRTTIDAFARPASTLEVALVACRESEFLCLPALSVAASARSQATRTNLGAADAAVNQPAI